MHDARLVREVERIAELDHDVHRFLQLEALLRVEEIFQLLALDQLHDDVRDIALLGEIEHLDDVGVVQARHCLRLAREARRILLGGVGVERAFEYRLDRDPAVQPGVVAFVDDAHCAFAEDAL